LHVIVDAQGNVASLSVARSSGSRLLDDAAVDAVRRWRFAPARRAGVPVAGSVEVPILFRLTG
jgi:protein TonB